MTNLTTIRHITTSAGDSTAVGAAFPTRIRGFNVLNSKDTIGTFEIKNGLATGVTDSRIKINIAAGGSLDTYLADEGVRCDTGVVVSATPSVFATIYFG
tara:strand:+ start:5310 stop:5606 length:297 start_codon:yes stop_codon:yes gene_type:complete